MRFQGLLKIRWVNTSLNQDEVAIISAIRMKFLLLRKRPKHNTRILHTVIQNEYYTPRLRVFRFDHLRHLPKEKMTQMVYHFKALI